MYSHLAAFSPDAGEAGGDLLLHPLDELPIGLHQPLLGLDLGHDLTLRGEGREGDQQSVEKPVIQILHGDANEMLFKMRGDTR